VLDVLSSTTPRPSGRKHRWARHLAVLAMKADEKRGLSLPRSSRRNAPRGPNRRRQRSALRRRPKEEATSHALAAVLRRARRARAISARSRNLRFSPIPRGLVQSFNARGRRGGFAAPGAVAADLCCGPRYVAVWHTHAHHLTTSRGPRDEALRDSATPTRGPERRMTIRVGCGANT